MRVVITESPAPGGGVGRGGDRRPGHRGPVLRVRGPGADALPDAGVRDDAVGQPPPAGRAREAEGRGGGGHGRGPVSSMCPGSALLLHADPTVIVDEDAAGALELGDYYRCTAAHLPAWQRLAVPSAASEPTSSCSTPHRAPPRSTGSAGRDRRSIVPTAVAADLTEALERGRLRRRGGGAEAGRRHEGAVGGPPSDVLVRPPGHRPRAAPGRSRCGRGRSSRCRRVRIPESNVRTRHDPGDGPPPSAGPAAPRRRHGRFLSISTSGSRAAAAPSGASTPLTIPTTTPMV